ncbi:uncharacterized protein TEOVI_000617400 [Trypanosoma equiperdum]|uniref:Uncharacterized protein n=2 Tax=Trypanozoon TaxID=39700 RepID=Q57UK4_TRYB2|nr:hypothetical protein, conserved [Trypanosoma brucei brucei TREU927]AAX70716.1 hypothetical protein, conserved [Trypanosoma brucei]AAZ13296.1 hypothetical protein, conserved [Trypanosoma brucei brucei TREU927]SCU68843.1 hypothetical protein, conserved [Trypanosoma equiperdum]
MPLGTDGTPQRQQQQRKSTVDSAVALIESDSELMALFFRHISACPPHGPFKHYSALTFTERVRHWFPTHAPARAAEMGDAITPAVVLQLMEKYYDTKHLRSWPLLYVPAQIHLKDVDALIEKQESLKPERATD